MIQEIYIIDDDETSVLVFRELFKNDTEYKFISVKSEQIDVALRNIPTIIIINEDAIDVDTVELCTLYTEMSSHGWELKENRATDGAFRRFRQA